MNLTLSADSRVFEGDVASMLQMKLSKSALYGIIVTLVTLLILQVNSSSLYHPTLVISGDFCYDNFRVVIGWRAN